MTHLVVAHVRVPADPRAAAELCRLLQVDARLTVHHLGTAAALQALPPELQGTELPDGCGAVTAYLTHVLSHIGSTSDGRPTLFCDAQALLAALDNGRDLAAEVQALDPAPAVQALDLAVPGLRVPARSFSLHTLSDTRMVDLRSAADAERYSRHHGLAEDDALLPHFLSLCGLDSLWAQASLCELGWHSRGGHALVSAQALERLQHQQAAGLRTLARRLQAGPGFLYEPLVEKAWLHLFELPFVALTPPQRNQAPAAPATAAQEGDPSMARALASIDRLLSRDRPMLDPQRALSIVEASLRDFLPRPNETPQWVPAYVPELARIGQVGQRLHEHALG
ncbi:MAG: hypothetical protein IPG57_02725 [Burkholderiales bacterium]|jgi:hypothetical protein|nr:hypothetical protein [Burkholderiales bacterium]MBP7518964.1 hypothetical protein [Leptothrix sp. (in: b-proteobacteria)]